MISSLSIPPLGKIDSPEPDSPFRYRIRLRGWVLSRNRFMPGLHVRVDGRPVTARIRRTSRPDVLQAYPWARKRQPRPGFSAEISTQDLTPGDHEVAVWARFLTYKHLVDRRVLRILSDDETPDPLLFVHIPKTAGTSLTSYLTTHYLPDAICQHMENHLPGKWRLRRRAPVACDLMTAHLEIETLDRLFDTRRFRKLSVFRQPERQLISHLAWIRGLGELDRQADLEEHPGYVQSAVRRLAALGPAVFLENLTTEESRLLDNCQTRYLLPQATRSVDESRLEEALARLEKIDLVGTTERLDDFLLLLAHRMGWAPAPQAPRLNPGRPEALARFDNAGEDLQRQIARLTRLDRRVYAAAEEKFSRAFGAMLQELGLDGEPEPDRVRLRKAIEAANQSG